MSGDRETSEEDDLTGYEYLSSRPRHDQQLPYTTSALGSDCHYAPVAPASVRTLPGEQPPFNDASAAAVAAAAYQSRESRLPQDPPPPDLLARRVPAIQTITPTEGPPGTKVTVYLCAFSDLEASPAYRYSLMFGSQCCASSLTKLDPLGQYPRYLLAATAPPLSSTGWVNPDVPIHLRVDDEAGQSLGAVKVGNYTYTAARHVPAYTSPPVPARKRKSSASPETLGGPAKRTSQQHLRSGSEEDVAHFAYPTTPGALYRPYLPVEAGGSHSHSHGSASPSLNNYATSPAPVLYGQALSTRGLSYPYSGPSAIPVTGPELQSSRPPSWSTVYSDISSQPAPSPALTAVSAAVSSRTSHALHQSSPNPANPPLIRTSTITQSPGSASALVAGSAAGQAFNPYGIYPQKALLRLQGDLDSMAEDWTVNEWEGKRRLVQFQRQQSGSTIYASFQPISPEERAANSICISCILWEEKNECYVTSVDTIYLLESLVAVRFTVEEKNRIRRNLEGFRPLTVSKGKADSEDFFKVIMGFPAPKPRNIEKDVKVFPWKVLAHALKKIIGKYSASYSSTAGALGRGGSPSTLVGSAGGGGGGGAAGASTSNMPHASPDFHGIASPASLSPAGSPAGAQQLSPMGAAELRLGVTQVAAAAAAHNITSSPRPQPFVQQQQHHASGGRNAWALGYVGADPASSSSSAAGGAGVDDHHPFLPPTTSASTSHA